MFDAYGQHASLENAVEETLLKLFGIEYGREFEDFSFDYYDTSFEMHRVQPGWVLPDGVGPVLLAMGFSRAWLNYREGESPRERSYYFGA